MSGRRRSSSSRHAPDRAPRSAPDLVSRVWSLTRSVVQHTNSATNDRRGSEALVQDAVRVLAGVTREQTGHGRARSTPAARRPSTREHASSAKPVPQQVRNGKKYSARRWGITKRQVRQLVERWRRDPRWSDDDSIRNVVDKFIKPMTRGTGMGVALMLNEQEPLKVTLMTSHCWDENAKRFFDDIEEHVDEEEVMFICFLSLYQKVDDSDAGPSVQEQLGDDIHAGPFAEIIESKKTRRMLTITNAEMPLCHRLWCMWEQYVAAMNGIPVDYVGHGVFFDSEEASSGDPSCCCGSMEDTERIRQAILSETVPTYRDELAEDTHFLVETVMRRGARPFCRPGRHAIRELIPDVAGVYQQITDTEPDARNGYQKLDEVVRIAMDRSARR